MFKHVILIISMLITTQVSAHESGPCPSQLVPVSARLDAYGYYLAELASKAGLLSFRLPEYRKTIKPVLSQIVGLQKDLGKVRGAELDSQAGLLLAFEMKLAEQQQEIKSTIHTGLIMFREARPEDAAYYFGSATESAKPRLNRGVQHPARPMKRETLRFNEIPGLEDWPYDFSATTTMAPEPPAAEPGPAHPPAFWDWQIPGIGRLNWPPKEKP